MSLRRDESEQSVRVRIGPRQARGTWAIAALLVVVAAGGALGRLAPPPASPAPAAAESILPTPQPAVVLVRPSRDVLYLRTTEVAVQGVAAAGFDGLAVAVIVGGRTIGETSIDVDPLRRFNGLVSIIPPATRSAGLLEVRESGASSAVLAEVAFVVEAGGLIIPRNPSSFHATAGSTLVVDVLVYGPLREIRGLLTSEGGTLIAKGSTLVGARPPGAGWPRTVGLSIEIPLERVPEWARLHVLAIDRSGTEVEHVDANVALSNG